MTSESLMTPKDLVFSLMYPLFSLLKRTDSCERKIKMEDGVLTVTPSNKGAPSMYDKEVLIFLVSKAAQEPENNTIILDIDKFFHFTGRLATKQNLYYVTNALYRFEHTAMQINESKRFTFIKSAKFSHNKSGWLLSCKVVLSGWVMDAVQSKEMLTLSPEYFEIKNPTERRLYEIVRQKHRYGKNKSLNLSLSTLYTASGLKSSLISFRRLMKKIRKRGDFFNYKISIHGDMITFSRITDMDYKKADSTSADISITDYIDYKKADSTSADIAVTDDIDYKKADSTFADIAVTDDIDYKKADSTFADIAVTDDMDYKKADSTFADIAVTDDIEAGKESVPGFRAKHFLDDTSPVPEDLILPRVLTPGGLMVLGGAPKVGKSDFLLSLMAHMAAGIPFLGMKPPHPLRIFYLQADIGYHYLRERLQNMAFDQNKLPLVRENLVITPDFKILLNAHGVGTTCDVIRRRFPYLGVDIIVVDPLRSIFDGSEGNAGENDNAAMLFFLQKRIDALRGNHNPHAGIILVHEAQNATFCDTMLRTCSSCNMILHKPDEDSTHRKLEIELSYGPPLAPKFIDKINGGWQEIPQTE